MIMFEMLDCAPDGKFFFSGNMQNGMTTTDGIRKAGADRPVLESRQERIALLRTGFSGKDIESLYIKLNDIVVIDVNWQE